MMDVGLIKNGVIENVITADSLERAQEFFPEYDAWLERTELLHFGPGWAWDGQTATEPVQVVKRKTQFTHIEFMDMLPVQVLGTLLYTEKIPPGQPGFDANLLVAMEYFRKSGVVDVTHSKTQQFVGYLSQAYGLAPEKAAEILSGV